MLIAMRRKPETGSALASRMQLQTTPAKRRPQTFTVTMTTARIALANDVDLFTCVACGEEGEIGPDSVDFVSHHLMWGADEGIYFAEHFDMKNEGNWHMDCFVPWLQGAIAENECKRWVS